MMYSKITIAGHPVHTMLVAFPVAFYTGALASFAVYAANGHHVGIRLTPRQAEDEIAVQQSPALHLVSHRRAS